MTRLSLSRTAVALLAIACALPASSIAAQQPAKPAKAAKPATPTTAAPAPAAAPAPPVWTVNGVPRAWDPDVDGALLRAQSAIDMASMAMPDPEALQATIEAARASMPDRAELEAEIQSARAAMPDPAELDAQIQSARAAVQLHAGELASERVAMTRARDAMASVAPVIASNFNFDYSFSSGDRMPPSPWAQGDPADSLYRVAWNTINRGDYRRAAELFASIPQKYPHSTYAAGAPYWQAFALYRLGGTEDLRTAARALEGLMAHQSELSRRQTENMDVSGLYARINGVLASRGDKDAAAKVTQEAQQAGHATCDKEDLAVRVEALNALARTDPSAAVPLLGRVLQNKGECSSELRRNAVFILGQRGDSSATSLLTNVARTDPDVRVREAAIEWLPRLPNAPISTIESLVNDTSVTVQRAAVRALMSSDDARARQAVRGLIENANLSESVRLAAVNSFTSEHATADDAAYLRGVFAKTDDSRMKSAIVYAVSRIGGADNEQWLLALAKNPAESSAIRATAIERLGRTSMSIPDLSAMYDNADSRNMRFQIINILADRKEPAATDKLLDIVRSGTDPNVRTYAIDALTRKKDPRTTKLLLDIIDKSAVGDEKKP